MNPSNPAEAVLLISQLDKEILALDTRRRYAKDYLRSSIALVNNAYADAQGEVQLAFVGVVSLGYGKQAINSRTFDTFDILKVSDDSFFVQLNEWGRDGAWEIEVPILVANVPAYVEKFKIALQAKFQGIADVKVQSDRDKRKSEYLKLQREFGDDAV